MKVHVHIKALAPNTDLVAGARLEMQLQHDSGQSDDFGMNYPNSLTPAQIIAAAAAAVKAEVETNYPLLTVTEVLIWSTPVQPIIIDI